MTELDRILLADVGPDPTPGFSASVMERIRAETSSEPFPRYLLIVLVALFAVLVGAPILIVTVEGSMVGTGEVFSSRLLLLMVLVVATSVAAILPMQLLDD